MSKISLSPDVAGTGIFTIASPNSNTNRTLTLPDDTGTIVTNSGNQAGSFTTLNTSGQVVFNDAGADVDFRVEGDTDANLFFVDASADAVGIGTTSPNAKLDIVATTNTIRLGRSTSSYATIDSNSNAGSLSLNADAGNIAGGGSMTFNFAGSEKMRIDSSGEVLIGTTSVISGGVDGLHINSSADTGISFAQSGTAKAYFYLAGGGTGTNWRWQTVAGITVDVVSDTNGVTLANGGTSWGSLSDERKKDIIEPIANAAEKVSSLRAVIGKYKTEEDGIRRSMLIAQDVQAVLPEAVVENNDGDLILQYTDTIPLLVAAIKELKAELDTVKAELATLKG